MMWKHRSRIKLSYGTFTNLKWMIDWVSNLECVSEFRGDHPSFGVGKYKLLSEAQKIQTSQKKDSNKSKEKLNNLDIVKD